VYGLSKMNKYDPTRGASEKTFLDRIIRNYLYNLVNEIKRHEKKGGQNISLDEPRGGGKLIDKIRDNKYAPDKQLLKSELKEQLLKAIQKLTSLQKEICRLIKEEELLTPTKLSRRLRIPRSTICYHLSRIREVFIRERVKDYWEKF